MKQVSKRGVTRRVFLLQVGGTAAALVAGCGTGKVGGVSGADAAGGDPTLNEGDGAVGADDRLLADGSDPSPGDLLASDGGDALMGDAYAGDALPGSDVTPDECTYEGSQGIADLGVADCALVLA